MARTNNTKCINWYGGFGQGTGYTGASENIVVELDKQGVDVRIVTNKLPPRTNILKKALHVVDKPFKMAPVGVGLNVPGSFMSIMNDVKIGFTMFETDRLPNGTGYGNKENHWAGPTGNCIDIINKMDELWVPCDHNIDLFKNHGCRIPIEKVTLGFDAKMYFDMSTQREQTRKDRPFTFLIAGKLTNRKNPLAAISAFMQLFPNRDDVKLIVKTNGGTLTGVRVPENYNIEIIDRMATVQEMQNLYRYADCFVFPSRGEGFGLTPLEAMATGLPTIFSDNTGMSEYKNKLYNYTIPCRFKTPARNYPRNWGNVGDWYEPDFDTLLDTMKYVVGHESEAKKKGRQSSLWVKRNFTYTHTCNRIRQLLNKW